MRLHLSLLCGCAAVCPLLATAALALAPGPPPSGAAPATSSAAVSAGSHVPGHPRERGFPVIQVFSPAIEGAESQNFDVASDPRGNLYVANLGGLLVYDGAWWKRIPIGSQTSAFAVATDARGRVAVGGVDEVGYLAPDSRGTLRYVSMINLLPPAERQVGQVRQIAPAAGGFIFTVDARLLYWDGVTLSTIATDPAERPFPEIFRIEGALYVWSRDSGLSQQVGSKLEPVAGGDLFRRRRVDALLPAADGLLVSVRGEGLFRLTAGRVAPFAPEASRWSAANRLRGGVRLADGRWALNSILGGLLLLLPEGRVEQVIDTAAGLPDDCVNSLALDRDGALWLALNKGLARVEVASPLSVIDIRSGLKGSAYAAARYRDSLWAGTAAGLFTSAAAPPSKGGEAWGRPVHMRQVPGPPPGVWSLVAAGDELLVGTAFGIEALRGDGRPQVLPGMPSHTAYALERSRAQPDRVWVGLDNGLAALRREPGSATGWRYEGMIDTAVREVRTIVEGAKGVVWCGSPLTGVVGFEIPADSLRPVRERHVSAGAQSELHRAAGGILVVQNSRVLRLDEAGARLLADPVLPPPGARLGDFGIVATDAEGNLWLGTRPPSVILRHGNGWAPEPRSLVEVPPHAMQQIFAEPDGVVWLAADDGLFRYAGPLRGPLSPLPAPHLGRITVGGGTVLFGGAPGRSPVDRPPPELPPDHSRLRMELAPLSFRAGLRYQTRIEPIDADWGNPRTEPFAELTQLPPGRYIFHARTLGPNGEVSPQTTWSFVVRAPWYLTSWALALALAAALCGIRGYTSLRSRALRQRAAQLEARVAEQTVELRHNLQQLRSAQGELEAANARLEALSMQDELTGIANRRRLQQVLAEEWSRARRQQLAVAFIILDLDHFKLLNDTQGHLEGDLCLQAVAGYLAQAVRRTGDLVARFGGEEFAILLPATGLAAALHFAEQLRQGIETLALPHSAAPNGRITASFGVAALVPAPEQLIDQLVEAADEALYRAKTTGRNRIWPILAETA